MANFTDAEFVDAVRGVAAERPGVVYEAPEGASNCLYAHEDGPGCIIGYALNRLGMSLAELRGLDAGEENGIIVIGSSLGLKDNTIQWAAGVQTMQDTGYTWGEAVDGRA